jgi:hypothetical protein
MAAAEAKVEKPSILLSDGKQKNKIVVTLPGNEKTHFAFSRFYKNKHGRIVMRPCVAEREHATADFISTTMFCPRINHMLCYGFAIDLDNHRCSQEYKVFEKICPDRVRRFLVEQLGEKAAQYCKLVRSRNKRGIHIWVFFPPFPMNGSARGAHELASKIQAALVELLAPFGADKRAIGLDRWASNWQNESIWLDTEIAEHRKQNSKGKVPVLSTLCEALKANGATVQHFVKPLTRFYPDSRVSEKVAEFVADHFAELSSNRDVVLTRAELLKAMPVSKTTLPSLLSSVVGPKNAELRGIVISKDLEVFGTYRVSADAEFWRVKHLAEQVLAIRAQRKPVKKKSGRASSTIMVFRPTPLPEDVLDGDRNDTLGLVAIKLKWSGIDAPIARRILAAYSARIPGAESSRNVDRQDSILESIYCEITHKTFGCRPEIAEAWLRELAKNPRSSATKSNCTKFPKGELQCPALGRPENLTQDFAKPDLQQTQAVGTASSVESEKERWLQKATGKTLAKNLASLLSLGKPEKPKGAIEGLARKLSVTAEPQREIPLSKRISDRLIADPRFEGERKALLLERIVQLRATGDEVGLQRLAKQLWPGLKL